MKISSGKLAWVLVLLLAAGGILAAISASRPNSRGPQLVEQTRQVLRQQGFKTDLTDFNFSTSPELRACAAILTATVPTNNLSVPFQDHPDLMEAVGTNSAVVVWKLPWLKKQYPSWPDNDDKLTWEEFQKAINANQAQVDAACAAILSGPIAFNLNADDGIAMCLPHLAMLKNLTQTLG
ncbi:MAG TPA: hypothetical protein VG077_10110, partial [Verrucomicrobiae bacterium]|nr:hypothetical protein [Verrucomicrobiae bacterium]